MLTFMKIREIQATIKHKDLFAPSSMVDNAQFHENQRNISYNKIHGLFCSKFNGTKIAF